MGASGSKFTVEINKTGEFEGFKNLFYHEFQGNVKKCEKSFMDFYKAIQKNKAFNPKNAKNPIDLSISRMWAIYPEDPEKLKDGN